MVSFGHLLATSLLTQRPWVWVQPLALWLTSSPLSQPCLFILSLTADIKIQANRWHRGEMDEVQKCIVSRLSRGHWMHSHMLRTVDPVSPRISLLSTALSTNLHDAKHELPSWFFSQPLPLLDYWTVCGVTQSNTLFGVMNESNRTSDCSSGSFHLGVVVVHFKHCVVIGLTAAGSSSPPPQILCLNQTRLNIWIGFNCADCSAVDASLYIQQTTFTFSESSHFPASLQITFINYAPLPSGEI